MSGEPPVDLFFAGSLIAVGALVAGLCGLCTGAGLLDALIKTLNDDPPVGGFLGSVVPFLLVGAVPTAAGVKIFLTGWRHFRRLREENRP